MGVLDIFLDFPKTLQNAMCCAATRSNEAEDSPKKKSRSLRSPGDKHKDGLYVSSLVRNGPAYLSQKVQVGDILVEVDGLDVEQFAVAELGPYLLGEPGSEVRLKFKRADSLVSVTLNRGFAFTSHVDKELSSHVDGRVVCGVKTPKKRASAPHSPVSIASVN